MNNRLKANLCFLSALLLLMGKVHSSLSDFEVSLPNDVMIYLTKTKCSSCISFAC